MERKPERKTARLRTETAYKANGPGQVAPHPAALGAGPGVKAEVVPLPCAFLSGETSIPGTLSTGCGATGNRRAEDGGGSRGQSTAEAKAGRPEPVGCSSPPAPRPATPTPYGRVEGPEASAGKHGGAQANLLEQIRSRDNRRSAGQRVKANQGAAGMDGMSIDAFPECARQPGERSRAALDAGTYRPAAGLRGMIPKATGGHRPLGMPPVLDRGIQPAIAQVIGPLFAPHFSTHRDGFRPGRRARMALAEREEAHRDGLRYAVDGDLPSCFDTVNHRLLMNRLARRRNDRRVLRLMSRSLRAGGILPAGSREQTLCGVPQGGPLSPLRAHGRLDALDAALERRGLRCARYADAFRSFVRSQAAAPRVVRSISRGIEGRLRRRSNGTKSRAARLSAGACLGFELKRGQVRWPEAAGRRFKERLRESTARRNGRSRESRIEALQRYVTGGLHDFGHSHSDAALVEWDHWRRRRVRLCAWTQGQRPRPRRRHRLALGLSRDEVHLATRSRKGYWRRAGHRIVQRPLTNPWGWAQGVPNMRHQWVGLHYGASAP